MEVAWATTSVIVLTVTLAVTWAWKVLNWLWLRPKRLEKMLRAQGLQRNPYKPFGGDLKELLKMQREAKSKPINLSDDIVPRVFSFVQQSVNKHGKNSFIWVGPTPRVTITDPELIKDVVNKIHDFPKPSINPLVKLLAAGVAAYEGEKWSKHRRVMLPAFLKSCTDLISKWEGMLPLDGSREMDVWPFLHNLASDVISRTAFGSSYEEGRRIIQLQNELAKLTMRIIFRVYIPGWRFLTIGINRRMKEIDREIQASLKDIINKREKALKAGEATKNDLLGALLELNHKEIQPHGNHKNVGMTLLEVIEECKLFYFAGQETYSAHGPTTVGILQPQYGAHIILRKVQI